MRSIHHTIFILFIAGKAIMSPSQLNAQAPAKDRIIDTVRCRDEAGQTYALYLPTQYDSQKSWPVIFIFDPSARGRIAVSAFLEAGRKYGFILACSNNSRNGPLAVNFSAASAMMRDAAKRFTIDQHRTYVAGFSGGSRFAMALALKEKSISGIIGCGAGLPNDRNYQPSGSSSFLYYGLAGNRDMNYPEMHELTAYFSNQTSVVSYLRTFPGIHEWPVSDLITEAVEWLILQTMNRKLMPADQTFISYIEKKTETLINSQLSSGSKVDAVMYMKFAIRDFQGTQFSAKIAKILTDTEKSTDYQKAIREWNKMATTEQENREKYLNSLSELVRSGTFPQSASEWWKNEMQALISLSDKGPPEKSQMAFRILNFISILCSEQGTAYFRNGFYEQAAFLFEICTLSDSENPNNYFNLAKSLAGAGKTEASVDALSAAMKHGFNSRKVVEAEPVFGKIKDDARFKGLMVKMK